MTKKTGLFSRFKSAFTRQKDTAVDISAETVAALEDQLRRSPNNFRLRLKLADTYLTQGDREKALAEYCNSARLYLEHDFTPLAIATYKKILSQEPLHLEANLELGRIYRQNKFYADATAYYRQAFAYYKENDLTEKALQTLETIIEIAPDKEPYRQMLQELFPEHQEREKSVYSDIIVTRAAPAPAASPVAAGDIPAESDDEDSFFDLGAELGEAIDEISIHENAGDHPEETSRTHGVEAIFQTLKTTLQDEPHTPETDKFHYNLALAYNELKLPEQALLESEEALKSPNFRLPALLLRSRIFLSQGALSAALSQVQQGLLEKRLTRNDFLTFKTQLGLILQEMGHHPQALEAFREAYALDPENEELARTISAIEDSRE
ncbi:MAG: tetratricopeptide repeat protein [Deltaproteobacteria bacterium]|nr:tetratricopeptide repeat protein [Deltaproteobacteria bacterium]